MWADYHLLRPRLHPPTTRVPFCRPSVIWRAPSIRPSSRTSVRIARTTSSPPLSCCRRDGAGQIARTERTYICIIPSLRPIIRLVGVRGGFAPPGYLPGVVGVDDDCCCCCRAVDPGLLLRNLPFQLDSVLCLLVAAVAVAASRRSHPDSLSKALHHLF